MPRCSVCNNLELPSKLLSFLPNRFHHTTIYAHTKCVPKINSLSTTTTTTNSSPSPLRIVSRTDLLNPNLSHVHFPLVVPSVEAIELALTTTRTSKGLSDVLLLVERLQDDYYLLDEIQQSVERTEPIISSFKHASEDIAARRAAEERTREERRRLEASGGSSISGGGRTRGGGKASSSSRRVADFGRYYYYFLNV